MAEDSLLSFQQFLEKVQLDPDDKEKFSTFIREEYGVEPDEMTTRLLDDWKEVYADSQDVGEEDLEDHDDDDEDEDEDED